MAKIKILSEHLMNLIAAGEVVERPAGIIKELIDNSIDAKSNKIDIFVINGGIDSICIIDNGIGMDSDDLSLAFERHATSKISDDNDLWNINTFGFRGEALPSIAAVSKVEMLSNNGRESNQINIDFGKDKRLSKCSMNQGTKITIKNLFQKTPARFKHLSNPNYELSIITDIVQKFSIINPNISFNLYHNDKLIFQTLGNNKIEEILLKLYNRDIVKNLMKVDKQDYDYKISGYVAQAQYSKANRNHIYLYINNRMVRNNQLLYEIISGYGDLLISGRYPIAIINIEMDPKLVDVNVHPTKWEVRLSKIKELKELLYTAIKETTQYNATVNEVKYKPKEEKVVEQSLDLPSLNTFINIESVYVNEVKIETVQEVKSNYIEKTIPCDNIKPELKEEVIQNTGNNMNFPDLMVIGQLGGKYILAQSDNGLIIIDQHAAAERINYEKIINKIENSIIETQGLLIPITLDIGRKLAINIDNISSLMTEIGIELDLISENECIVRSIPLWLDNYDTSRFILDILDIFESDKKVDILKLRKKVIATLACHSSIRFNRYINIDEMKEIVSSLSKCKQPYVCPHGRPTFIEMKYNQLEKEFYRVG